MNLYIMVEGKRTESIVYPAWLKILVPELKRIYDPFSVENNQYYLFSANGYPNILNDLVDSIHDINEIGKFDYLVVCLDADDGDVRDRVNEVKAKIFDEGILLSCELFVIVQKKCIESWFLGNRKMYTKKSKGKFKYFSQFYDVSEDDPEEMDKPHSYDSTAAQYHAKYLEVMLREKGTRYSKGRPNAVCSQEYLSELIKRTDNTYDLGTLKFFFNFCKKIRKNILSEKDN